MNFRRALLKLDEVRKSRRLDEWLEVKRDERGD
jgi:hypothetical protein